MTINHIWRIIELGVTESPIEGAVHTVSGYVYGEDKNGHNTTERFSCTLALPKETDPAELAAFESQFKPYSSLSEDEIISWAKQAMGPLAVEDLLSCLHKKISDIANPPQIPAGGSPGLPWGDSDPGAPING